MVKPSGHCRFLRLDGYATDEIKCATIAQALLMAGAHREIAMTLIHPTEPGAVEEPEAAFEIEEGHFGPHLPRPRWEMIFVGAGTLLILLGSYLPWLTLRQQGFSQVSSDGTQSASTTTTIFGGWGFVSQGFLHAQGGSFGGIALVALVGAPALSALVVFAMNVAWYRQRANTLTCAVALSALAIGLCVLFGETTVTLFIALLYSFPGGSGPNVSQIGFGIPLMLLGYVGAASATITMCARYWRRSFRAPNESSRAD